MPKVIAPLTFNKIKNAKPKDKEYKLFDGGGLFLVVKKSGIKTWRVKYRLYGKEKVYTIGNFPDYSLQEAREERKNIKKLIDRGIDPVSERNAIKNEGATFGNIFDNFVKFKSKEVSKSYIDKFKRLAEIYILPKLSNIKIDFISKKDIINVINDVPKIVTPTTKNTNKEETQRRVFMVISQTFKYALYNDFIQKDTTALINTKGLIPKKDEVRFKAIIDEKEIRTIYKLLEEFKGYYRIKQALKFLALSALRPGNVRNLRWEWVDFDKKLVEFPAEAMKMRERFRLPLTDGMIEILKSVKDDRDSGLVFYSVNDKNKMMSDNTMNVALKRLGISGHTSHGWRSSFSTICYEKQREHGFSYEVIESQLAHKIGSKVTRAYMRSDFLEERRELLKWWGEFLSRGF